MKLVHENGSARETIDLTLDSFGADSATAATILLLHGGAGPFAVRDFGKRLAGERPVRVLVPTHPGFDGTERPASLGSVRALAGLYLELLAAVDARDVTVIGSSIGGWTAAEIAASADARIRRVILVNAVGVTVPAHPCADFFHMTPDEVTRASFHEPERFRIDPATVTDAQRANRVRNGQAIVAYAGTDMNDPTLAPRLAAVKAPTLVLWGESDRIVTPDYGRAFAAAIPGARFQLVPASGHMPQLETPEATARAVWDFVDAT
jgi:pimeloyl-ACP methyl ester carboxylesterase